MKLIIVTVGLLGLAACGQPTEKPRTRESAPSAQTAAQLAHQVADIEITLAKQIASISYNSREFGNHPEITMIHVMALEHPYSSDPAIPSLNWNTMSPDETQLLRDTATRIAAASAGYDAGFTQGHIAYASWDPTLIVQAAQESAAASTPPDLLAALALQEIHDSKVIQDFNKSRPSPH